MCGIAGIFYRDRERKPAEEDLLGMAAAMRHRGPDGYGLYRGPGAGLILARLSIIDIEGGWQPLPNEDETVWVVCNGEIFNYIELRADLEVRGHRFRTSSDVEVIVHLYEERGFPGVLDALNGQFAICVFDAAKRKAIMARDRVGVHPLHYAVKNDRLMFASEAKALFADPELPRRLDVAALDQVFTFWGPLPGRTLFQGVREVPPAHYVEWDLTNWGEGAPRRYWECGFERKPAGRDRSFDACSEELLDLLKGATRIRLRADVPVGAYLSGGLDSSSVASLIVHHMDSAVDTFSIGFEDAAYDEDSYQRQVADMLHVRHRRILCSHEDIAGAMARVVWHAERPLVRTAAVPMYLLSSLVRDSGYRVVVTGEGADEFLGGYDIFKEALIRAFWARDPDSKWRPQLLKRLYPYFRQSPGRAEFYLKAFFGKGLDNPNSAAFSHGTRWETTSAIKAFYSDKLENGATFDEQLKELARWLSPSFAAWHPLQRAQHVEIVTLLSQYLLSSQGDRVAMANSVEARFPFLDPDVIDFSNRLPPSYKITGLKEKAVLKRAMRGYLPDAVLRRSKQPYMAPDSESFFRGPKGNDVVEAFLSEDRVARDGLFDPGKVTRLKEKCRAGRTLGFKDNMAFVGILSTQIFCERFLNGFRRAEPPAPSEIRVRHVQ